jgi:putative redox protein
MDMLVTFPGGLRVDASYGSHVIRTDQPVAGGGDDTAPAPFSLFLASIGTCAGIYVLGFCKARGIPTEGIRLVQRAARDPSTGMIVKIVIDVELPATFPERYRDAVLKAANTCAVKKHLLDPPEIEVRAVGTQA